MRRLFYTIRTVGMMVRILFRFVSGRPLSGQRKTDATFLRHARHSLDPSGTALRWEMLAGWQRAAWRMFGLYLLLLGGTLLLLRGAEILLSPPWFLRFSFVLWSHVILFSVVSSSWLLRAYVREYGISLPILRKEELVSQEEGVEEKLRLGTVRIEGRREWMKEKVLPVSRSAALILSTHIPERKAAEWVTIPKNYQEPNGSAVEIRLPSTFTGADEGVKKRLVSSVGHKLGMKNISAVWQTEGSSPRVLLSVPPTPPSIVSFSDVEDLLLASEEYRPLCGMTGDGVPLLAEMIEDSPHVGVSGGPGSGKSTFAKLLMMQALRWGWGTVVIDWKQTGAFDWLGGIPGVIYLSDIEKIHDMGVRLAEEIDIRKAEGMAGRAKILVVRDEWNVTAMLLQSYWTAYRAGLEPEERRTTPAKSPALEGYAILDFAGRELGMHDLVFAQRFSAKVFNGNADIRECFQIKALARYSEQTRKMLAPDIKPFPRKSNTPGRWTIVTGDEVSVVQVPLITSEEARKYALGGKPGPLSVFTSAYGSSGTQPSTSAPTLGNPLRPDATRELAASPQVNARKLSEMVDALAPLNVTHNVLRNAARDDDKGDPTFPKAYGGSPNKGYTYDFEQVKEWARRRHAASLAEGSVKG